MTDEQVAAFRILAALTAAWEAALANYARETGQEFTPV